MRGGTWLPLLGALIVGVVVQQAQADTQRLPIVYQSAPPAVPTTFPPDQQNQCFAVKPSVPVWYQNQWYWTCNLNNPEGGQQGAAVFAYDGATSRLAYAAGTATGDGVVWLNGATLVFSYFRQSNRTQQNVVISPPAQQGR
jgi:hypothetical protein